MATLKDVSGHAEAEPAPRPSGPAAAAILAGGIGSLLLGFFVTLVEASPAVKSALNLWHPAGPLSGKTTLAVAGFLVSWAILGNLWKGKEVDLPKVWRYSLILVVIGLLFTFPPIYTAFE